jgi:hypothetical protein
MQLKNYGRNPKKRKEYIQDLCCLECRCKQDKA